MTRTRSLAAAYDARIAALSRLARLRLEWERIHARDRVDALVSQR